MIKRAAGLILSLMAIASHSQGQELKQYIPSTEDNTWESFDEKADERMRRVVRILRTTDKAQVNQFVPFAYELKNVNPYAVLRFIRRPIQTEEGNWWTFAHPDGDHGIVLMNVPIWLVEPMEELLEIIDRDGLTSSAGTSRHYIPLKHRDPQDVANLIRAYLTNTGVVLPDLATGSIYLQDAPSGAGYAQEMIPIDIDLPTKQVTVRTKIYEIDLNNDGTIGLDFHAWKNGPGRDLFTVGAWAETFSNGANDGPIFAEVSPGVDVNGIPGNRFSNSGFNSSYIYNVPSAYFDYLVQKGRARILTSPTSVVLNRETALFNTGEEVLYYKTVTDLDSDPPRTDLDGDAYDDTRRGVYGITTADVGVHVEVTPVIAEQSINMDFDLSFTNQLGWSGDGTPLLQERNLETKIRATPGAEYLIGGMTRTRTIQTTRKVPVLGSIPVLGWLFGGEITTTKKTMLVISLSATVINDDSGLNADEQELISNVDNGSINQVPLPKELYGFDMMLLGRD